jgi:ATP-dependent 26S proteasome regulatory subunit
MNKQQINNTVAQLGNDGVPVAIRSQQLIDILAGAKGGGDGNTEACQQVAQEVFTRLQNQTVDENAQKMAKMLKEILTQLEQTPLKPATFIQLANVDGGTVKHALITDDRGEMVYVVAHDQAMCKKLVIGDRVMVDAHAKILVTPALNGLYAGHEARFERKIDERHIEVVSHQDEKVVVMVGPKLMKQIDSGEVEPGSAIVVDRGQMFAIRAMPLDTKMHFRFLDRGPVPDVLVHRDIGSPPRVIEQIGKHVREEMTRPDERRRFKLRPCITRLLAGVSGSGKTLSVQAIHRLIYEIMSEITGTPIKDLPARVFRFRTSKMLSMWLGESDKNIDRLFDEVEEMAAQKFTNAKGKTFELPVMVVMEEADGMGRARGQEAIYDRIMTTILQRLDPNREGLANKMVVFISTTNEQHLIDPAFLRRIGGSVETFGRLDQKGFIDIMHKMSDGLPAQAGKSKENNAWEKIIGALTEWMYQEDLDSGVLQLTYQGQSSRCSSIAATS